MGIAQAIDWIKEKSFEKQINEAIKEGNFCEYTRLVNLRNERDNKLKQAQENYPTDLDYYDAMIVLDAAENGIFFPNAHEVFEKLDNRNIDNYDEYEYESDYYDEYYDDYNESEYSDHWGLG
jgi:hypothetical protein